MKICPVCKKNYNDSMSFCPQDNEILEDDLKAMVGQTIDGQYLIEKMLGQGGMGAVFLARHTLLGDRVAIKVMPTHLSKNPEYQRRFLREGQAARRFRHPNVVTVHDLRNAGDGTLYMVLEYIDGNSLHDELKKRKHFTPEEAVNILSPIADALDTAHSLGVIHRDLKPDNIMIGKTEDGSSVVKLLDLGVAKVSGNDITALTIAGQILGTPHYMSPEQWNGEELDGRADIYSLGIVFYELIAGRRPFEGRTLENLACQHALTVPPPLAEVISGVPIGFSQAIARTMAKDCNKRQANCRELFNELRAALKADAGLQLQSEQTPTLFNIDSAPTIQVKEGNLVTGGEKNDGVATLFNANSPSETLDRNTPTKKFDTNSNRQVNTEDNLTLTPTREDAAKFAAPATIISPDNNQLDQRRNERRKTEAVEAPPDNTLNTLNTLKVDPKAPAEVAKLTASMLESTSTRVPIMPIIIGIIVVLSIGGWFGWQHFHNQLADSQVNVNGTAGNPIGVSSPDNTETVELLRFWFLLAPDTKEGSFNRTVDISNLPANQAFRIHFTAPQKCFLYIVATGKGDNSLMTFLTAKPFPEAGVESNEIKAGQQFDFPAGLDSKGFERLITLEPKPSTEIYTIIYSPSQLSAPAFLTAAANHNLNINERKEWEHFRATNTKVNTTIVSTDLSYVKIDLPKSQLDGKPIYFDITCEHK